MFQNSPESVLELEASGLLISNMAWKACLKMLIALQGKLPNSIFIHWSSQATAILHTFRDALIFPPLPSFLKRFFSIIASNIEGQEVSM
jgi:hypothetical protein